MKLHTNESFTFAALDDFSQIKDPKTQLENALEFGIRIIECRNLNRQDWRVVEGPFWRFRRKAASLLLGHDGKDDFYIRKIEASTGSNIRLFYYDLKTKTDAIIEIKRKPGLCLTFRTGWKPFIRRDLYSRCTREHVLRFITSDGDYFDIV